MDNLKEDEFKSKLLLLFKKFIAICSDYNLSYYCAAGTALGVMRHQGFIPWDDDIDVVMFRSEYDRFITIVKSLKCSEIEIVEMRDTPHYHLPYAKFCDKKTTLIENKFGKCVYGLYIDIFPLDGISGDVCLNSKLYSKYNKLARWLIDVDSFWPLKEYWDRFRNRRFKQVVKMICVAFVRKPLRSYILESLESIAYKYDINKSSNVINYIEYYGFDKAVFPKEWFGNGRNALFEGLKVKIPYDCEKYLTLMYGDYLQLPSVEKRVSHHTIAYLNLHEREDPVEIRKLQ